VKGFIRISSKGECFAIAVNSIAYVREGREEERIDSKSGLRPVIRLKDGTDIKVAGEKYEDVLIKIAEAT
jgi:hypothetical protein